MKRGPKQAAGLRLEPDARRAHLLAVGATAFGAMAYEDVQIDQIAQQAGVSRGLLYHYFPGKRDFFAAIIQGGYDEILDATRPDTGLPPEQQLQAGLQAYLDYVEAHPHLYRALFRSTASADPTVREVVDRNLDVQARRILGALGPAAQRDPLAYVAVRAWLAFLVHAVLDWLDRVPRLDRQALMQVCMAALQGAMLGFKPAAQPQARKRSSKAVKPRTAARKKTR